MLRELQRLRLWPLIPRSTPAANLSTAKRVTASYEYRDPVSGELVGRKDRLEWTERGTPVNSFAWWQSNGNAGLHGAVMPLYRGERLRDLPPTIPIEAPEGEKCVHAFEAAGMVAVCTPNGAGTTAGWGQYLDTLRGRRVRLWPDNDDIGRAFMAAAADALYGVAAEVKIVMIPGLVEKGDGADYLAAGYTAADLERFAAAAPAWTPEHRFTLTELLSKELPPLRWAIEGILPEGLTLFGGKSKLGKSWAALSIALAIASGGVVFGAAPTEQGDVLYLALEDYARHLQDRVRKPLRQAALPAGLLEFWTACPRLDEGGTERIEGWLRSHPATRLVVIDTLKQVRPRRATGRSAYDEDYDCLQPLFHLAQRLRVPILVVHHLRQDSSGDPLDQLNGMPILDLVAAYRRRPVRDPHACLPARAISPHQRWY